MNSKQVGGCLLAVAAILAFILLPPLGIVAFLCILLRIGVMNAVTSEPTEVTTPDLEVEE